MASVVVATLLVLSSVQTIVQGIVLGETRKENATELLHKKLVHQPSVVDAYWPTVASLARSSWAVVEGRGKKGDKGHGALMMMGGMFVMMGLTALAALSGKALAAAMAALLLAAMSLMRKGHHGGAHSYEIVSVPHHSHHHRSLPEHEAYATAYAYENPAESLPTPATQMIHNHQMSVQ